MQIFIVSTSFTDSSKIYKKKKSIDATYSKKKNL